jgi:NADPH-dependent 2,4-dienoyl-CoA reductase/sulfur reductase-like enzyme
MSSLEPLERDDQRVVIIGAGLAGLRVAEGLRAAGFPGRIVLVGDEAHEPYDRPPLSKAVLERDGSELSIQLSSQDMLAALTLSFRLGERAVSIDRIARQVELESGERLDYDRLVLATGSRIRALGLLPPGAPRVRYLRGLDDAIALRAELSAGRKVAIVGGGVIGLEVAASARSRACEVTVIEAASRPMARTTSPTVSDYMADRHRAEGVGIRLGVTVAEAAWEADAVRLRLSDGDVLTAETVVVGVGVTANVELAEAAGLDVLDGGVLVDGFGATSDPAIYAAGEVACHLNARHGSHERQETWNHASAHGEHVGRAMVAPGAGYGEVASYWSDQYDINLQIVGAPMGEVDVVRGDPAGGSFLVFHVAAGEVVGVSAIGAVRQLRTARKLIGVRADPATLGAPDADLTLLLQA